MLGIVYRRREAYYYQLGTPHRIGNPFYDMFENGHTDSAKNHIIRKFIGAYSHEAGALRMLQAIQVVTSKDF
jgi:hypothetical protein